jgi:dihydropteroate synthase
MKTYWQTSKRKISFREKTLVMAILNVTPDSFSDGGKFFSIDAALGQAEKLIAEGADILDVGGESTRPASVQISAGEEIRRVVPVIELICKNFDVPVSIDTTKSIVAETAVKAGAEIINDISGLRFDEKISLVAAEADAALVLMHSRGEFATIHKQIPLEDIVPEVASDFRRSIKKAESFGVKSENIALDIGIGFSKTFADNLELLAKLDKFAAEFQSFPLLVGVSRKSFIGKLLGELPTTERINGSLAAAAISVWNGANIVRVHDVKATVEALKVVDAIKKYL